MGILAITLQDLRFRARQFLIAVAGTGLVFAMGLLLSGMVSGFSIEINQTVDAVHAQWWVTAAGASGRVTAMPALPAATVQDVAREPGVTRADPIIVVPQAALVGSQTRGIVMIGTSIGALGNTTVAAGRPVRGPGEAVVDARFGLGVGGRFTVTGRPFRVVGTVSDRCLLYTSPSPRD